MSPQRLLELRELTENTELHEWLLAESVPELLDEVDSLYEDIDSLTEELEKLRKDNKTLNRTLLSEFEAFLQWKKHGLT